MPGSILSWLMSPAVAVPRQAKDRVATAFSTPFSLGNQSVVTRCVIKRQLSDKGTRERASCSDRVQPKLPGEDRSIASTLPTGRTALWDVCKRAKIASGFERREGTMSRTRSNGWLGDARDSAAAEINRGEALEAGRGSRWNGRSLPCQGHPRIRQVPPVGALSPASGVGSQVSQISLKIAVLQGSLVAWRRNTSAVRPWKVPLAWTIGTMR